MNQQSLFTRHIKKNGANISIILSIIAIVVLCVLIVKVILSIDFRTLLLAAGENLETDSNNHTNLLLIGTGGEDHDGADLTDTIIVASLDQEKETVSMISIPRDLHVKDDLLQSIRINETYFYAKEYFGSSEEGLAYFEEKIEELTGLEIHYHVKINFGGFKQIIDSVGGIELDVPESIYDPYYPKDGTLYYETFQVPAGYQHMDGETALKYARSRKTTSDFDRSKRQQQIIHALKNKALQTKVVLDKDKLTSLLSTIKDNLETNLKVREMITMGAIAGDYNSENIITKQVHDDPVQCGGFLYAPPIENNGGAFVLTPAGGEEYMHLFFELIAKHPLAFKENLEIQVLNGTEKSGIAAENKQVLKRYCLNVSRFGNARSLGIKQTTIYYNPIPLPKDNPGDETEYYRPNTLDIIKSLIPEAVESTVFPQEYIDLGYNKSSDILLEIGTDYVNSDHYIEDSFYPLYNIIYAPIIDEEGTDEGDAAE